MRTLSGIAASLRLQKLYVRTDALASVSYRMMLLGLLVLALFAFAGCGVMAENSREDEASAVQAAALSSDEAVASADDSSESFQDVSDKGLSGKKSDASKDDAENDKTGASDAAAKTASSDEAPDPDALFEELDVTEDYRSSFVHGEKPAKYQRYIVLHDTEGADSAKNVIDWWDSNGNLVAAHFIVNKDGSIWQCVPLDKIAHHAGFGDTGHNVEFGTNSESRDDKLGTQPIGDWAADYGMNSYSVGIEMVHQGGEGDYPKAQLEAVDALIAYIDAYYGFESQIIDHKAWRSGNSDTSEEFAPYLKSYQQKRTHK